MVTADGLLDDSLPEEDEEPDDPDPLELDSLPVLDDSGVVDVLDEPLDSSPEAEAEEAASASARLAAARRAASLAAAPFFARALAVVDAFEELCTTVVDAVARFLDSAGSWPEASCV